MVRGVQMSEMEALTTFSTFLYASSPCFILFALAMLRNESKK